MKQQLQVSEGTSFSFSYFNPLLNGNTLDLTKLKTSADDKFFVTQKMKFPFIRQKTTWKKEKIMVIGTFSFSDNVFTVHLP